MDISAVLASYDREQRIEIAFPGMRRDVLPQLVRFVRPLPGMSFVLYSSLDEASADAAIEEQVAYFRQLGQPFDWKVYDHDTPPDLAERLGAHGFVLDEREAIMALDLSAPPASLLGPPAADVRPIERREQLRDVIAVEEQVWGGSFDWITERLGDHLEQPGYLSVYVAYAEGRPACAGWIYFHQGSQFASLWGGSTLAADRGRGLYSAVLAVRVQEAIRRGYRYLTIDASPMSRPIVARHGFQLLTYARDCKWRPAWQGMGDAE